jgi:hypothetical protein
MMYRVRAHHASLRRYAQTFADNRHRLGISVRATIPQESAQGNRGRHGMGVTLAAAQAPPLRPTWPQGEQVSRPPRGSVRPVAYAGTGTLPADWIFTDALLAASCKVLVDR